MNNEDISMKVRELRQLKRMQDELAAEIAAIQNEIKAVMTAMETDTLTGTDWKVTWQSVSSPRLDIAALKKALPDVVERFTKTTTVRRFCVA